jgi:N-acetylmuramoyl-L-alanine amidase
MKILIDNGHGKESPGKRSPDATFGLVGSPFYYFEWENTRKIANAACDIFQAQGYDAELLVPETWDVPLDERVRRVNEWCAKLGTDNVILVSIHSNAAGMGDKWMNVRGWSIWTTRGITQADKLAREIFDVAEKEFRPPLRVMRYGTGSYECDYEENFSMTYCTWCPAVLIEGFFHDNKEDVLFLNSDKGRASCAYVITEGVINYIRKYGSGQ